MRCALRGQALVEFALTLSMFTVFVLVVFQLGLLFVAYYSETRMARETARWLAVNSRTTLDSDLAAHVQSTMLPGLANGTPTVVSTPTCANGCAEYMVGSMDVQFTPCNFDSGNHVCTNANRASGQTLSVQLQYNVATGGLIFLPRQFRMGNLVVQVPQSLPAYRVSVMVE
jgi:hypothetical protein